MIFSLVQDFAAAMPRDRIRKLFDKAIHSRHTLHRSAPNDVFFGEVEYVLAM